MEKFENKIEYCRYKQQKMDKIVLEKGTWQVSRKTVTLGYDALMGKWVKINAETTLHPISEAGCLKSVLQTVYVKRVGTDSMLKPIELWLKVVRKISVKDLENNIYLKEFKGRIFQTDLTVTAPMNLNYVPRGIKIEKLSETPLSREELQKLSEDLGNEKVYLKPIIAEENQAGELKLLT
jgi:hypothetical protein